MKLPPGYVPGSGVHKATAFGGIGEKLMQEMGWEKGQGLGKDKKGMKKAIEVKLKDDTVGVGANPSFAWEKKWWEEAFDSKAQQMQAPSSDSSDDSDDDVILNVNRDGTLSSAKAEELKIAAALAKDPWGRFGGRKGKMARIARQEAEALAALQARSQTQQTASTSRPASSSKKAQAAAALGRHAAAQVQEAPSQAAPAEKLGKTRGKKRCRRNLDLETFLPAATAKQQKPAATAQETYREPAAERGSETVTAQMPRAEQTKAEGKKKSSRKECAAAEEALGFPSGTAAPSGGSNSREKAELHPAARQVHVVPAAAATAVPFQATPRAGWWGSGRFVSAGCLEGIEHTLQHVAKERQAFDESTQEGLYMAAHEGRTANKKGLGSASAPRKVAGTRWQGTRTLIEDDANASTAARPSQPGADAEAGPALQNFKWRKLVKAVLLKVETRSMPVKALKREALRRALESAGLAADKSTRSALRREMSAKIQGSSMFTIEQGVVRLASKPAAGP